MPVITSSVKKLKLVLKPSSQKIVFCAYLNILKLLTLLRALGTGSCCNLANNVAVKLELPWFAKIRLCQ